MKVFRNGFLAALMLAIPALTWGQMADEAEVKSINTKYDLGVTQRPSFSFLDLSRLKMSQSYGISFFSGGGYSGSLAMYSNTISYQLARPLTLTLNLGILHDPGALLGNRTLGTDARFLPSGWLDWKPSDNFWLSIGFETRSLNYGGSRYYYPGRYRF